MIRLNRSRFLPPAIVRPARRSYQLGSAEPVLRVPNVERTCRWYAEELGFKVTWLDGDDQLGSAELSLDGVHLLVQRMHPGALCLRRFGVLASTTMIHIAVTGIDVYYAKLASCVRLLKPSRRRSRGIGTLVVEDCDGTIIVLTEDEDLDPAGP